MRRVLVLSLIASLLANQAACIAHSHAGTDVAEPGDHAARPHVHLGGHSHRHTHGGRSHSHSHAGLSHGGHSHGGPGDKDSSKGAKALPVVQPVSDHDADALYVAAIVTLSAARLAKWTLQLDSPFDGAFAAFPTDELALGRGDGDPFGDRAPRHDSSLPVFLQTHCLRC